MTLPPNCFVIIFPKMEIETLRSEGLNNLQINQLLQKYIDENMFKQYQIGSLKTDFDIWRENKNNNKMNNILVIHPKDPSTDFLKEIYSDIEVDIIDGICSNEFIVEQIKTHDRVFMMGHGSSLGLFGKNGGYVINSSPEIIEALNEKQNNVYIWCHANEFVENNNLKGFATGMIISEYEEAYFYNIIPKKGDVEYSNQQFASCVKQVINLNDSKLMCEGVKNNYQNINDNEIIEFNSENIYYYE